MKSCNAKLGSVLCVIERNPEGRKRLSEVGLQLNALFTMEELKK
ncbi:hypothetical protein [Clostridium bornimense]|nr:hypothetical protein [Clostridium bornimense]